MGERDHLLAAMIEEVLGPRGGPQETLGANEDPRNEYVTGVLAPRDAQEPPDIDAENDLPEGEEPAPTTTTTSSIRWLSERELADTLANLPAHPLGGGADVRVSLGGVQQKLVVTRAPNGRFGLRLFRSYRYWESRFVCC